MVIDDIWHLINISYKVKRDDPNRTGWILRSRPIVLLHFWVISLMCFKKFIFISNFKPRWFWDILLFNGVLLRKRAACNNFLTFLINVTFCASLVKSRWKIVFLKKNNFFLQQSYRLKYNLGQIISRLFHILAQILFITS